MNKYDSLLSKHRESFGDSAESRLFTCPGRINLIGEHIDYNGGFVLPAAIDKTINLVISPNDRGSFRFQSTAFPEIIEISASDIMEDSFTCDDWWVYPAGVLKFMTNNIWNKSYCYDMSFESTVPVGGGLSSSAALSEVVIFALSQLLDIKMSKVEMVLLGQKVERELAGVSCGTMDQFAVVHGKKDHAVLLDTRNFKYEYVPVKSEKAHFILVNSMVKHSLKDSGYNERRESCENALRKFKEAGVSAEYLCEVSMDDYNRFKNLLTANEAKRAEHAISENLRTLEFNKKMKSEDYIGAGHLLFESHNSLRDNFEVSIPELDKMVEWARNIPGVFGSRLMGGGFGGCTISMVSVDNVENFKKVMAENFRKEFGKETVVVECVIDDGVREIKS